MKKSIVKLLVLALVVSIATFGMASTASASGLIGTTTTIGASIGAAVGGLMVGVGKAIVIFPGENLNGPAIIALGSGIGAAYGVVVGSAAKVITTAIKHVSVVIK